ncbi:hypothetical protein [Actinomadura sp. WMMB 499]|uniref:hypothetical protein n=1 Tax=Actinomadura sp. WMMB 499 TaxID=1219491 RepID=UPI0012455372|nr:hypothetical protein [Actinomadura sp. WMMB 499]QFG23737.1 hypothetical protein F7P10_24030 [Actinomadura sp. WMMB 499]
MRLWLRRLVRRRAAVPLPFALILPDEMSALDLVDSVGLALACSRDVLAAEAEQAQSQAHEEGDRVHRAYLSGRADALAEAVARTDTAMANLIAR